MKSYVSLKPLAMEKILWVKSKEIGAAEERVEGNEPVKGATMGFQNFSLNSHMMMIR